MVTVRDEDVETFLKILAEKQVPYGVIGTVGGDRLNICEKVDVEIDMLRSAHEPVLERLVSGQFQSEELSEG